MAYKQKRHHEETANQCQFQRAHECQSQLIGSKESIVEQSVHIFAEHVGISVR